MIQIYFAKRNPDVLKAERFFKERKTPVQLMDLTRHKLGRRELETFARAAGGAAALVDRSTPKALERPVAHMTGESLILDTLMDSPTALRTPIVRDGQRVTIGVDEAAWRAWLG